MLPANTHVVTQATALAWTDSEAAPPWHEGRDLLRVTQTENYW